MSRSVKKGPYVEARLLKRVEEMNNKGEKKVLKMWATPSPSTMAASTCRFM